MDNTTHLHNSKHKHNEIYILVSFIFLLICICAQVGINIIKPSSAFEKKTNSRYIKKEIISAKSTIDLPNKDNPDSPH